jgi:hypothetical protein
MPVQPNAQPAPQRQTVLTFATPSVADLLFYETVDAQRVGLTPPAYGTAHPDTRRFPNHKLVFVQNDAANGQLLKYFYAADRASQDAYNYELKDGVELIRTYVLPRTSYPADLPVPDGGTLDAVFTSYGFVGDSILDVGEPLNGWYIAVQRRYVEPSVTEVVFDDSLERNITVTKTIKPSGYTLADDSLVSGDGVVYEIRHGNAYHDILLTTSSGLGGVSAPFPFALPTIYSTQDNYPFPPKLTAYEIIYQFAGVVEALPLPGESPRFSYSEDMLPTFTLVAPQRGPYKTKIERWLTDDPETKIDAILASATYLPQTKRETVVVSYRMLYAEAYYTQAFAREFVVPESYHGEITIDSEIPDFSSGTQAQVLTPEVLPATAGFSGDLTGTFLIDVSTRKTASELYEVTATSLVLAGIYA